MSRLYTGKQGAGLGEGSKLPEKKEEIDDLLLNAETALKKGLNRYDARDFVTALKHFYESSQHAVKAVLLAFGLDTQKKYGVGKFLIENKAVFPEWFANDVDDTAEVIDNLAKNRPKVVVFLVSQPMWYMHEYSLDEYEAIAKRIHPRIQNTINNCIQLVHEQMNR